jgi:hypothetical protein
MYYLRVKPENISTLVKCYPDSNTQKIQLKATNEKKEVFKINEDYIFSDDYTFAGFKDKERVDFHLSIYNADTHEKSWLSERGIGKDKVGELRFKEEFNSKFGIDFFPASIFSNVFISKEQYELVQEHILSKVTLKQISFDIDTESVSDNELTCSGLDSEVMIWNIPKEVKHPMLVIKFVEFFFSEDENLSVDSEVSSVKQETQQDVIDSFYKEIKEIKYLLLVLAIPAFLAILKLF